MYQLTYRIIQYDQVQPRWYNSKFELLLANGVIKRLKLNHTFCLFKNFKGVYKHTHGMFCGL